MQTVNRVVYLNGLVDYGLEKSTAESVAKQVVRGKKSFAAARTAGSTNFLPAPN